MVTRNGLFGAFGVRARQKRTPPSQIEAVPPPPSRSARMPGSGSNHQAVFIEARVVLANGERLLSMVVVLLDHMTGRDCPLADRTSVQAAADQLEAALRRLRISSGTGHTPPVGPSVDAHEPPVSNRDLADPRLPADRLQGRPAVSDRA